MPGTYPLEVDQLSRIYLVFSGSFKNTLITWVVHLIPDT
jgi:hypothetical protein